MHKCSSVLLLFMPILLQAIPVSEPKEQQESADYKEFMLDLVDYADTGTDRGLTILMSSYNKLNENERKAANKAVFATIPGENIEKLGVLFQKVEGKRAKLELKEYKEFINALWDLKNKENPTSQINVITRYESMPKNRKLQAQKDIEAIVGKSLEKIYENFGITSSAAQTIAKVKLSGPCPGKSAEYQEFINALESLKNEKDPIDQALVIVIYEFLSKNDQLKAQKDLKRMSGKTIPELQKNFGITSCALKELLRYEAEKLPCESV